MDNTTQTPALIEALDKRSEARGRFLTAKPYTPAWRKAGKNLDFWAGKVATLTVLAARPV